MAVVTLDTIRAAAEAKYGALEIPLSDDYTVRLLNVLRLTRESRDALIAVQEEMQVDGADIEELLKRAIRIIAATPAQAERLLEEVGGDLAVLTEIFRNYTESSQVGEASASAG